LDLPKLLAAPVEETLYFAGEATVSDALTGTVFGAFASGLRAAEEFLRELRNESHNPVGINLARQSQERATIKERKIIMPARTHPRGATAKEQRQDEHIKKSAQASGRYGKRAKEVAARTVMKRHSSNGRSKGH
jgi:hypothetical protein